MPRSYAPLELRSGSFVGWSCQAFRGAQKGLGDGDLLFQIDILYGVDEGDAFVHGALEGFSAHDEAHAAGAFINDGGAHGFGQVGSARRSATGVDESDAAHVVIDDLVAA